MRMVKVLVVVSVVVLASAQSSCPQDPPGKPTAFRISHGMGDGGI